ncbi:zf-TFIIB domain-containing protein (plasmid) [Catenovulum sp. SX2]|uniref:zf-TFIIB domain-containing protein n=1 Tax=Catenovulum sp. SX2 TaxID=3398614 RepID=UPI003F871EA2
MKILNGLPISALKCEGCAGLWFKDGQVAVEQALEHAQIFDSAENKADDFFNQVREIDCPECAKPMSKMTDKTQFHIKYEMCTDCRGIFLDQGELLDLSEFTLTERLQQAIKTYQANIK